MHTLSAQPSQTHFLFLNVGHFLDHLFMLIFASVAALRLSSEWNMSYAELIPYATPGFIAFGVGAIVAGWVADKWSREGMIVIFFIGIGISSILASFSKTPLQIAASLTLIGAFAAIYHPVGLSLVIQGRVKTGLPLAINGVFGNMGVASAALLTGFFIDNSGWRTAFIVPGIVSIVLGVMYFFFLRGQRTNTIEPGTTSVEKKKSAPAAAAPNAVSRDVLIRVFAVIFLTTALGGLIFQSTTFALPKIFDERLGDMAGSATMVGWYAFLAFSLAALAQLVVGHLIDNHSVRIIFAVVAILQAVFFLIMTQMNGAAALIVSIAFMFVVFGQIPINDVLVGRMARSEWRSRAFALRYIITFSVMASAVPLIGWIHGHWGFNRLFMILGIAALFIFCATLLLPKSGAVTSAS
ncbi:MAG: MFS transporter [bacterium]